MILPKRLVAQILYGAIFAVMSVITSMVLAQEREPLSVEVIQDLLKRGVTATRVADLIDQLGVSFEPTNTIKERLKKAGADAKVMEALDRAGREFVRKEGGQAPQNLGALLERARGQLAAEKLTTPRGDNALESYQEVLRSQPGHEGALEGIRRIKGKYVQWAEAAKQRGDWTSAEGYYEKAMRVDPGDNSLKAALAGLREQERREAEKRQEEEKEEANRAG
jgi:tetratricopeptide (TPR) repeat protein